VTCLGLFLGGSVTAQHLTGKNMNAALQTDAEATASFEAGPAKQNVSTSLPPPGQPPEPAQKPVEPRQF
jgi:hypothetical protein